MSTIRELKVALSEHNVGLLGDNEFISMIVTDEDNNTATVKFDFTDEFNLTVKGGDMISGYNNPDLAFEFLKFYEDCNSDIHSLYAAFFNSYDDTERTITIAY